MPADDAGVLQAYADGVNAFITSHQDALPLEFTILGYKPDPWTPVDTIAFGKVMAWDLGEKLEHRAGYGRPAGQAGAGESGRLLARLPRRQSRPSSASRPCPATRRAAPRPGRRSGVFGGSNGDGLIGSNNWVIDGSLSADGHPLLANDPHLSVQNPRSGTPSTCRLPTAASMPRA